MPSNDQAAVVQELYRRRDTLAPERRAVVEELAKRLNISEPAAAAPAPAEQAGPISRFFSSALSALNPMPALREWAARPSIGQTFDAFSKIRELQKQGVAEDDPRMLDAVQAGEQALAGREGMASTAPVFTEPLLAAGSQVAEGDIAGGAGTLTGGYGTLAAGAKVTGKMQARQLAKTRAGIMERMGVPDQPAPKGKLASVLSDPEVRTKGITVLPGGKAFLEWVDAVKAALARRNPATPEAAPAISPRANAMLNPSVPAPATPLGAPAAAVPPAVPPGAPGAVPGAPVALALPDPALTPAATIIRDPKTGRMINLATAKVQELRNLPARQVAEHMRSMKAEALPESLKGKPKATAAAQALAEELAKPESKVTEIPRGKGIAQAAKDADTLAEKLAEWKFTPDEAKGMNQRGWATLAHRAGVPMPTPATQKSAIFGLVKKLVGKPRTVKELYEHFKASGRKVAQ